MEDLLALRRHEYTFSDSESDSESLDSENDASSDDDEYKALRPPPLQLHELRDRIVRVQAIRTSNNLIRHQNNTNTDNLLTSSNDTDTLSINVNSTLKLNDINNHDVIMPCSKSVKDSASPNTTNLPSRNNLYVRDELDDVDINQLPFNKLVDLIDKIQAKYSKVIALNKKVYSEQLSEAAGTSNCDNLMPYFDTANLSEDVSSIRPRNDHKDNGETGKIIPIISNDDTLNEIQFNSSEVVLPFALAPKMSVPYSEDLKYQTLNRHNSTQSTTSHTNHSGRCNTISKPSYNSSSLLNRKISSSYCDVLKNQTSTRRVNNITSEPPQNTLPTILPFHPNIPHSLSEVTNHETEERINPNQPPKFDNPGQRLMNANSSNWFEKIPPLPLDKKLLSSLTTIEHHPANSDLPIDSSHNTTSSNRIKEVSSSFSKNLNHHTTKEHISIQIENLNHSDKFNTSTEPSDSIINFNSFKHISSPSLGLQMSSFYSVLQDQDELEQPSINNSSMKKSIKINKSVSSDSNTPENIPSTRNNFKIFKPTKHDSLKSLNSTNLEVDTSNNTFESPLPNRKKKEKSNLKTTKSNNSTKTSKEHIKTKTSYSIKKTAKTNITLPKKNEKPIGCKNCEYHCNKFKSSYIRNRNNSSAFNSKKRIARGKRLHRAFTRISKGYDLHDLEKTVIGISFSIILFVLYGLYAIIFHK